MAAACINNSTLFSHAFYLAIEGGRNATSGVSVTGVGAANRAQIEKVFFRADDAADAEQREPCRRRPRS